MDLISDTFYIDLNGLKNMGYGINPSSIPDPFHTDQTLIPYWYIS